MILYHVGHEIIERPDTDAGRVNADLGKGFYLSDDREFSVRWARFRPGQKTILNVYELDLDGLDVVRLERDMEWFRCIFDNRRYSSDRYENSDVIIAPIANDTIYDTFGIFTSGIFADEEALELMKIGNDYTQVVVKSRNAADRMRLLEAMELGEEEVEGFRQIVREEEKEYQELLSEKLETL